MWNVRQRGNEHRQFAPPYIEDFSFFSHRESAQIRNKSYSQWWQCGEMAARRVCSPTFARKIFRSESFVIRNRLALNQLEHAALGRRLLPVLWHSSTQSLSQWFFCWFKAIDGAKTHSSAGNKWKLTHTHCGTEKRTRRMKSKSFTY